MSLTKKARIIRTEKDELYRRALELYRADRASPNPSGIGARTFCLQVSRAHFEQTKRLVSLSHATLLQHHKGGRTLTEFNEEKGWLTAAESDSLIAFGIEMGERGFPFTHQTLRHAVMDILVARMGDEFERLGVNWADRFLDKHFTSIKTFRSSRRDGSRARAVNPNTDAAWWAMIRDLRDRYGMDDDCMFGIDETGFMPGVALSTTVIGSAQAKSQYQHQGGSRENITVLVCICADGTAIPPLVIFKGQAFSVRWAAENPLNAS